MDRKAFCLANGSILSLSDNFVLPADVRPVLSEVSKSIAIPVIDLDEKQPSLIKKISEACEEYGIFQIINHGVPKELCQKLVAAVNDFFRLPPEERSHLFTDDKTKPLRVSNYYLKVDGEDKVTMWSETLVHPWHPVDDFAHLLPRNPLHYRELAIEYAKEMGWLTRQLLCLISQGLGLNKDSLQERLGHKPRLVSHANYYPPCPQPELTLGSFTHTDITAITILLQSEATSGLQVIKDGQWVAVDPVPDALVVVIGDQIQVNFLPDKILSDVFAEVLSNGRYKSVHHRAVTNKDSELISIAMFCAPDKDSVIGPMEEFIDKERPPVYRNYRYAEFLDEFYRQESTRWMVKEVFELRPTPLERHLFSSFI